MINIQFYSDCTPIVFASNDFFVPYMATMMQSIIENAQKGRRYCFFVLYKDISEQNINLLKKQITAYEQFSIDFINVSEYFNKTNIFISRHLTIETYFRLLIPYIFCEYQKIIYLDGDMICRTDIAELFNINIDNYLLAAVWDTDVSRYYCPDDMEYIKSWHTVLPNLKDPNKYFNGGFLIFNTKKFRELISLDELIKLVLSRKWNVHDQDILNFLADGKTLLLPYSWNFMYSPKFEYLQKNLLTEYIDAEKNPNIIHYKPWDKEFYIPFFECFWKYATRTPFNDIIIERMKTNNYFSYDFYRDRVISNIKNRNGLGFKFILDCFKAWVSRNKKL
jgi:lipopolysaccharide biosynthesis glycosyltransferase